MYMYVFQRILISKEKKLFLVYIMNTLMKIPIVVEMKIAAKTWIHHIGLFQYHIHKILENVSLTSRSVKYKQGWFYIC